ncbi:hypothetical protein E4U59_001295 [Claviceps monticola]|nr:hypothetical protein E4U59_001295 [Claviceps monticola]
MTLVGTSSTAIGANAPRLASSSFLQQKTAQPARVKSSPKVPRREYNTVNNYESLSSQISPSRGRDIACWHRAFAQAKPSCFPASPKRHLDDASSERPDRTSGVTLRQNALASWLLYRKANLLFESNVDALLLPLTETGS